MEPGKTPTDRNYFSEVEDDEVSELPTPEGEYQKLTDSLSDYMDANALKTVEAAYLFAAKYHAGQTRRSGEEYVTHPLAVARILAGLKLDISSIIAAILHDTVEDTSATIEEVEQKFGDQVAQLVDGLTKIGKVKFRSNQERLAENFRKMILAMAKDLRVVLIKLADRLHNMRTIKSMPPAKAKRIAQETLDIYAPLANRLGIYGLKSELEDICLRILKNDIYQDIRQKIAAKKTERQAYIDGVKSILENELRKYHFKNVEVYGRPKHFYSIYKKMLERKLEFEDIHDLFAFRIIVDSIKDCYEALGIVHAMWKPMPGRFKDYIAMPKANLYQSLHTTVIRPNGEPAEIQIRTREMQKVCEYGIAAHWAYKEKSDKSINDDDMQKFSWLRQIVQWQQELKDPDEFLEAVKVDLFDEEIFVFTPRGDVISLPNNATALDFAFAVHTDVGLHTIGAKVNSSIVPLKRSLKSGDIVEILTSPNQKPNKDWLNFVTTSKARNKIRSSLRKEQRDQSRHFGRELIEQALHDRNLDFKALNKSGDIENIKRAAKESSLDDAFIAVGYGRLNPKDLVDKAFPKTKDEAAEATASLVKRTSQKPTRGANSSGILVSGLNNVLVNVGKCCAPLPGEPIIGFITRGRGVTVHRANCSRALDLDPQRRIDVSWGREASKALHSTFVRVVTKERTGVLAEVTHAISTSGANIYKADVRVSPDLLGILDFEIGIQDLAQLEGIIRKIEGIPSVVNVERKSTMKTR